MKFTLISSKEFKINKWSGGTTTQLYMYPPTANYQQQNFDFRLSSATVEIEESTFTLLPEVSRKLIVLEGSILINHKNQYSKQLQKFDIDTFEGNWETSSIGKCTDFNLMTTGNTISELSSIKLQHNQSLNYLLERNWNWIFIYVIKGKCSVFLNGKEQLLTKENLLVINDFSTLKLQFKGLKDSVIVISKIQLL
ncbi:MAG: hypothetical protein COC22_06275 [Flavobacteriaceae bacterium]|nr:MAG: hypothetical protein COC22_06275 [Flavobacteriaceae bacterium]